MWVRVNYAIGALFGCVLGLGASVTVHDTSSPSIASVPLAAVGLQNNMVLRLTLPTAHADSKRRKRTRERRAAESEAEEKRIEEADKKLQGTRRATLPADCVYDSSASATNSSETYVCGGFYYERYTENGVSGYEGHPVGSDRGEIKRAKARRAEAVKKRQAEAKKKLQASRRATLPKDCGYDSYASASSATDIYVCRGVWYRQYEEKGVTGYEVVKP